MQGDPAARLSIVQDAFHRAMASPGLPDNAIAVLARRLSVHLVANPLSIQETQRVEACRGGCRSYPPDTRYAETGGPKHRAVATAAASTLDWISATVSLAMMQAISSNGAGRRTGRIFWC